MAIHSSVLAWRIPGTGEPGGLPSLGSQSQTRLKQLSSSSSSKITADGDCSHEIKRCLVLGRKAMTNLDSMLKSRDITLPTKVHLVKAMVFPVIMYGCESWTVKKAECQRMMLLNYGVGVWTLESSLDCNLPGSSVHVEGEMHKSVSRHS